MDDGEILEGETRGSIDNEKKESVEGKLGKRRKCKRCMKIGKKANQKNLN